MYQNIEKQEKYWDSTVESFDSIYTHQKGKFANYLDKKLRWDMYARFDYTIKNSEPIDGKTILDVGCGTGKFAHYYALNGAKKVVGIDISQKMIDVCNERAKKLNIENICTFIKADPFEFDSSEKFDITIGIGLFDYIIDANAVINRMKKFTSGKIIMSFPRKNTLRAYIRKTRLYFKNCDVYFYTINQVLDILARNSLKKENLKLIGQLICVTSKI